MESLADPTLVLQVGCINYWRFLLVYQDLTFFYTLFNTIAILSSTSLIVKVKETCKLGEKFTGSKLLFVLYCQNFNFLLINAFWHSKKDGVALLMTDSPPTSSNKLFQKKYNIIHDTWNKTHEKWHVTHYMRRWTFLIKSLVLMVCEQRCFEDIFLYRRNHSSY